MANSHAIRDHTLLPATWHLCWLNGSADRWNCNRHCMEVLHCYIAFHCKHKTAR